MYQLSELLLMFFRISFKTNIFNSSSNPFIFKVPVQTSFIGVMDMFYKVHKIFDLEYEIKIKNFMLFIDFYIFENVSVHRSVGSKTHDVAKKILSQKSNE